MNFKVENRHYRNDYITIWVDNGIVRLKYELGVVLDMTAAKEIVHKRLEVCDHHPMPMFIDARGINHVTKEARNLFSSEYGTQRITASGIVIKSQIQKTLGNLWFRIDKPSLPVRLFNEEESAVRYLSFFKNPN